MFRNKGYKIENFKFSLLITVLALSLIGLVVLHELTLSQNTNMFNKQIIGLAGGIFVMLVVSFIDYRFICKFCIPLYIFTILLMLFCRYVNRSMSPYVYGKSVDQARRWIHIGNPQGGLDIMPSEITKIVLILCLAKLFVFFEGKINRLYTLFVIFAIVGVQVFFVYKQPDLSTSIVIITTFLIMLFIAGLSYKIVIPFLAVSIPGLIAFLWYIQQDFGSKLLKTWQRDRILSLLHPEDYPDLMYQQNRAKEAIASGKIFGKLITGSKGTKMTNYVPVVESDFIYSGVGEELGFIGAVLVIVLFLLFLFFSLKIAFNARDKMGKYIASGIAVMITIQAFVNIGVVLSILPNTGIPLPFMSSGLSSLLTNFMNVGILLNVGMQNKDVNPVDDDVIVFGKYHNKA